MRFLYNTKKFITRPMQPAKACNFDQDKVASQQRVATGLPAPAPEAGVRRTPPRIGADAHAACWDLGRRIGTLSSVYCDLKYYIGIQGDALELWQCVRTKSSVLGFRAAYQDLEKHIEIQVGALGFWAEYFNLGRRILTQRIGT